MRLNCSPRLLGSLGALVLCGTVATTGVTVAHATGGVLPIVSSVTPSGTLNTEGDQQVLINGSGFTDTTPGTENVQFGSANYRVTTQPCPTQHPLDKGCFTVNSDILITAFTPSHPQNTNVDITVTTDGGTSAPSGSDRVNFVAATPQAASVSPHSGPPGTSITMVPAAGSVELSAYDWPTFVNFSHGGATVQVPVAESNVRTDAVVFNVPSSGLAFNTAYDLTVTTVGGNTGPVNASTDQFTLTIPSFHPSGVGAPAVTVQPDGTQLVFWQGAGNHLIESWWNGFWNGPVDWTAGNGWAATVDSTPTVALTSSGVQIIFWMGPGGHLFEAWWNGSWNGPVDWTAANHWAPSMTSAPSAVIRGSDSTQVIFWQGGGGHLMEVWWNGSWNGPVDWTAARGWAATVASAPNVSFAPDGTTQLVFWRGPSGHLMEAWWNGVWNGPVDWTASTFHGAGVMTSAPSVMLIGSTQAIFWQGAGGHLTEVWWNGQWNGPVDVTSSFFGNGHTLTSAPAVTVQANGTQLIFWQGAGAHLVEAWWNGSWNGPVDWSA
jgi:hypothetical protein